MSDNGGNTVSPQQRLYILFYVRDDARFLSHRETQTIWQRAFVRADIPICYSQGFNPHIKISLPLPRNVGVASECEVLVVHVSEMLAVEDIQQRLEGQLPDGIQWNRGGYLPAKEKVIPTEVSYELTAYEHVDQAALKQKVEELNAVAEYLVEREARGRHKARSVNIKNNIKAISSNDNVINLTMVLSQGVTARLDEIAGAIGLNLIDDIEMIVRNKTHYNGTIEDILKLQ